MKPFSNNWHSNVKEKNSGHLGCNSETNTVTTRGFLGATPTFKPTPERHLANV